MFAVVGSYVESRFYRAIVEHVNDRAGRYFLFATLVAAGMWNAGTAFLASTTAMHATMLAYSFYLEPTSAGSNRRVYLATFFFAAGALFAWPFALLLSVPFVLEELFVGGKDVVLPNEVVSWRTKRVTRLVGAALVAGLVAVSRPSPFAHERGLVLNIRARRSPSLPSTRLRTVA